MYVYIPISSAGSHQFTQLFNQYHYWRSRKVFMKLKVPEIICVQDKSLAYLRSFSIFWPALHHCKDQTISWPIKGSLPFRRACVYSLSG